MACHTMANRKLCQRVTKEGTPCKHKAIPGSEFCHRHQPRELWLPRLLLEIFLVLITIIITWEITGHYTRKSLNSEFITKHITRPRNVPTIRGFPVVIADSANIIVKKPRLVPSKGGIGPFDYRIDEDGVIRIYGEIRRADGTIVVEASGNHIMAIPGSGYDINNDSEACEIVDSHGRPIYQISIVPVEQWRERVAESKSRIMQKLNIPIEANRNHIDAMLSQANEVVQLFYIHRDGEAWWCVTPEGCQRVGDRERMKEWQSKIQPLFKYPGHKYPGTRINN